MKNQSKIAKSIRLALTIGAITTALPGAFAFAQEAETEEEASGVEKIAVTGSRIRSANLNSVSPLQSFDAGDIDASGVANLQELLLDNPTFGTPTISRTNSNFNTASAGIATVDLRNLGTARTLVLVNGRRFVSGQPGEMAVDMNTIPAQFIERVEILTGGASSVYGSDAVAGVVNLILKNDFEGVEFEGQYGQSSEGDDTERQFSITTGATTDSGKGNIMFHLGYTDQGGVFSRDRERSAVDQFSTFRFTGDPADAFTPTRPFFSSFPPQGRFDAGGVRYTFDSNNNLQEGFSTNGDGTIGPDGFNRSDYRRIAIPTERYLFASKGSYELSDNHAVFFEANYAASQTVTELEPFPFASDDIYADGAVPLEFDVNGTILTNPYVPDEILNSAVDVNGDGLRDLDFFAKRLLGVANRGNIADRDTFRFTLGFEGELVNDWFYDIYYVYGQTKEAQISSGQVNVQNFRYALEAVTDTLDLDEDGITDEAICVDETARSFGCVPIDIYGFGSITPEAAAYINAPGMLSSFISQEIFGGNISGDAFELPAGPLGVAVGFEYREETSRDEFDALQQAGLNAGNAIPATKGEFDVTEFYIEANIPIIEDVTARAAYRTSDYSTVGSTSSWNVGFDWQITDWMRLRAIEAESVRAPNINELFSPPSQTFPPDLNDPCAGVTASDTGTVADRCKADPGIAANIAANGSFTLNQSDIQGISGFNRGNANLIEETGKSTTIGLVFTPDGMLEDFGLTIDYFDIEIENAIVPTPRQFILDQCYGGDQSFCQFITRRAAPLGTNSAGSLEFIDSADSNSGGEVNEGVDLTLTYSGNVGPGRLNSRLAYTYVIEGGVVPLPGAAADPYVGEIGASEHRANLNVSYDWDAWSVSMGATYIGSAAFDDQFLAGFDLAPGAIEVGSEVYVDTQVTYQLTDTVELFAGVDNLFDPEPPAILSGMASSDTGTETEAGTYDPVGRRWYLGARARF
ncbi:TonB-dependent receptor domain-containing protein [Planctobacterium marinum]|uniref:TonB-dependent receptor n=1 Tax=Planctobacterium marinum TaxID=1631968 RepID=A0AA48HRD7_9ALTE|nr:TonB-dependent receptor [Planctobacterium marinum]